MNSVLDSGRFSDSGRFLEKFVYISKQFFTSLTEDAGYISVSCSQPREAYSVVPSAMLNVKLSSPKYSDSHRVSTSLNIAHLKIDFPQSSSIVKDRFQNI